jgi:hypothetical protein
VSQPETPEPEKPHYPPPTGGGAGAVALFIIGVLIVLPSGLCTAVFGFGAIYAMFTDPETFAKDFADMLPLVAVTLVFLAIGILAIRASFRTKKNR